MRSVLLYDVVIKLRLNYIGFIKYWYHVGLPRLKCGLLRLLSVL